MAFCLKLACLVSLAILCGCRDYTPEELKQQLLENDGTLKKELGAIGAAATNAVLRGSLLNGSLNEWGYGYLIPIKPNSGGLAREVPVRRGALGGLRIEDYRIMLHLENNTGGGLKPSFRVTFYDRHLRFLGEVSEHWLFSKLLPSESKWVEKSRAFYETPWYFSVTD